MIKQLKNQKKSFVLIQAVFIYAWLTILSPLSATDTYYSVYALCAVAALLCMCGNYKAAPRFSKTQTVTVAAFSVLFSMAVLLGNYELFDPLSVLQNLFDAACAFAGGFSVAYQILTCMLNRLPLRRDSGERRHSGRVFALAFGSIAAIDLLYLLFALYPGVLTTDSFTTISQIMGNTPYDNVMPFWHTVTVEVFIHLGLKLFGDMNAAVALFHGAQILFMAACFGFVLTTLYQIGVPKPGLAAVYAIYAFMPYNIVYSVTLWKDIPFAGAAVLFVTAFYRLLKNVGKSKVLNYIAFTVGVLGFSLWRTNGWYAFLVTVIVMFFLLRKSHKKLLILMAVVLLICWVLINPVLDAMDVGETNFVEAFAVPMQQIARVVANGRELTQEETGLLSEIFWMDKIGALYDPQTVDPVKFETFRYDKVDYIKEHAGEYGKLYLSLGARYPGDYFKAWIEETRGYWNGGYFFWTYTLNLGENQFGIHQTGGDNIIAKLFAAAFRYIEKPAILQFTISIGLYVWGLISCCVVNVLKKQKEFLLTIPLLVLVVGLWLGTPVYSEFRYAYPIILSLPMILCVTLYHGEGPGSGSQNETSLRRM